MISSSAKLTSLKVDKSPERITEDFFFGNEILSVETYPRSKTLYAQVIQLRPEYREGARFIPTPQQLESIKEFRALAATQKIKGSTLKTAYNGSYSVTHFA